MIKSFKNLLMKDLEPRYMQKVYELDKVSIRLKDESDKNINEKKDKNQK